MAALLRVHLVREYVKATCSEERRSLFVEHVLAWRSSARPESVVPSSPHSACGRQHERRVYAIGNLIRLL